MHQVEVNMNNYEIEKKFVIKYPDLDFLKSVPGTEYSDIEQIYLLNEEGFSERIRKRGKDGNFRYYHTLKKPVTDMTRIEEEREISKDEYNELKKKACPELNIIYKTRYCIDYKGHTLEIDVFPFWKNQAFLEIELSDESEIYEIPDYLEMVADVTSDKKYTNHALAKSIPNEITA